MMDRRVFHGQITPIQLAQALIAAFDRGNLRAQTFGNPDRMIVQIATRPHAASGGQTALTVTLEAHPDGVIVQMGQQEWWSTIASLGKSALTALRNPLALLGRLDDIAQDIENLQLAEKVWKTLEQTAQAAGAAQELSERFQRVACEYCGSANPLGEPACVMCGAPLGRVQSVTCPQCGFLLLRQERVCPNCHQIVEKR